MSWFRKAPEPPIFEKKAVARIYQYDDRYLICSVAHITETDSLTELPSAVDDAALGEALLRHLIEYRSTDDRDARNSTVKDWKAFQISGARSVKSFEQHLWHIDTQLRNGTVEIDARPRNSLKAHLSVTAVARCHDPELVGAAVKDAIAGAKLLRSNGLV